MIGASLIVAASTVLQAPGVSTSKDKPYTSPGGGYTVALPAGFVERKRSASFPGGDVALQVVSRKRGVGLLSVASGELASEPGDPDAVLAAARDDVLGQVRGKLGQDRAIEAGGTPGREFRFEIPRQVAAGGAVGLARVFLKGKQVFQVVAIQSSSDASVRPGELAAFLDSFRFTGARPAAVAPRAVAGKESKAPAARKEPGGAVVRKEPGLYESTAWKFQVGFPGKPQVGNVDHVEQAKLDRFTVQFSDGKRVFVTVSAKTSERMTITKAIDFLLGTVSSVAGKGKVLASRDVKTGEVRGKEYEAIVDTPLPGTYKKLRVFVTGNVLYLAVYYGTQGAPRDGGDAFLDFLTIFEPEPFEPGGLDAPSDWKSVPLPLGAGTIRMPGAARTIADLGPLIDGSNAWKLEAVGSNSSGMVLFAALADRPEARGKYSDADHEAVARALSTLPREHALKLRTMNVEGKLVRLFSSDVKSFKNLGHVVFHIKTFEDKGRICALAALVPAGFEYELIPETFFKSYSEK